MKEIHAKIVGKVQGVAFRDATRQRAEELEVSGYVHNTADGAVEVVAQGDKNQLRKLIAFLRKGTVPARVDDISIEWREPSGQYDSFTIQY